jgi:hypothetical protein
MTKYSAVVLHNYPMLSSTRRHAPAYVGASTHSTLPAVMRVSLAV